jgi:hypothetical protein
MWDGMFTLYVESSLPDADWRLLHAYARTSFDLRRAPVELTAVTETIALKKK